jgi:guanylate kinase
MTYTKQKGVLLVVTAPLGVGKQTLCHAVLDRQPGVRLSVSCTTRAPLLREIHGFDYLFLSEADFKKKIQDDAFIEYVQLGGKYYGTLRAPVVDDMSAGHDVILNVDTQGAQAIKFAFHEAITVFVSPATVNGLESRFLGQTGQTLDPARLKRAQSELASAKNYDFVILNDNLLQAAEDISSILRAERRRPARSLDVLSQLLSATVESKPAAEEKK